MAETDILERHDNKLDYGNQSIQIRTQRLLGTYDWSQATLSTELMNILGNIVKIFF